MNTINIQYIKIKTTGVGYVPDPPVVKPGYEVTFEMDGRTDKVNVDFGSNSPFVGQTSLIPLDGGDPAKSSKTYYVAESADGHYPFDVTPLVSTNPEPPTVTAGDLEVTRDPPKPKHK